MPTQLLLTGQNEGFTPIIPSSGKIDIYEMLCSMDMTHGMVQVLLGFCCETLYDLDSHGSESVAAC